MSKACSSTLRCRDTAGIEIGNDAVSSETVALRSANSARIARRVGSASAENTVLSWSIAVAGIKPSYLTDSLNVAAGERRCQAGRRGLTATFPSKPRFARRAAPSYVAWLWPSETYSADLCHRPRIPSVWLGPPRQVPDLARRWFRHFLGRCRPNSRATTSTTQPHEAWSSSARPSVRRPGPALHPLPHGHHVVGADSLERADLGERAPGVR